MSYKAIIARISVRPHPNADRLQLGVCKGYQVTVGKEVKDGTLGIFFEAGGQLSEEFARENKLIKPVGMFEENRRVKAIKLRGQISEGFWCELDKLSYLYSDLGRWVVEQGEFKEGMEFDTWKGKVICQRYETPATKKAQQNKKQQKAAKLGAKVLNFPQHVDTGHFRRMLPLIQEGAHITVTVKLHGTSHRQANAQVEVNRLNWGPAWLRRLFGRKRVWMTTVGSRRVNIDPTGPTKQGFYGSNAFRFAWKDLPLHKGEVLYGEIVGYLPSGAPIMGTQSTAPLKDKEVKARYGDSVTYNYNEAPGHAQLYVYRMCMINEDGVVWEYSQAQIERRCRQLGLRVVPVVYSNVFNDADMVYEHVDTIVHGDNDALHAAMNVPHPHEGVVVRADQPDGTTLFMKHKSWLFGVLEGYIKDNDAYVDAEEAEDSAGTA